MALTVTVNLPASIESQLRALHDLDATAKEALVVTLYRRGVLSYHALTQALDIDRFEAEAVLKRHNVTEDLGTPQDYLDDARKLRDLLNDGRR